MSQRVGICDERLPDDSRCQGSLYESRDGDFLIYSCEVCGSERAIHERRADPVARQRAHLDRAGLPARFQGLKFEEDDDNRDVLRVLREWLAGYRDGPLPSPAVFGECGRGKSHLLTALCVRLVRECDAAVMFTTIRRLLRDLQDFDGAAPESWRRAVSVDVLALDDVGAERVTGWRQDQFADLVDERYQRERPIVLATNFPPSLWDQAVDVRTASRLLGMTFPVELRGRDRRQLQTEIQSEGCGP